MSYKTTILVNSYLLISMKMQKHDAFSNVLVAFISMFPLAMIVILNRYQYESSLVKKITFLITGKIVYKLDSGLIDFKSCLPLLSTNIIRSYHRAYFIY